MSRSFELPQDADATPFSIEEGYRIWSAVYDDMLTDTVDGAFLAAFLEALPAGPVRLFDVGCGTGRNAAWLKDRGLAFSAHGIDPSAEMLARARAKGLYDRLDRASAEDFEPVEPGAFDLALCVLVSCHVPDLGPLYRLAARLLVPGGRFWLVDMHPCLFHRGKGTCVPIPGHGSIHIRNWVHDMEDHVRAARAAGLSLADLRESVVPEAWGAGRPNYADVIGQPLGLGLDWRAPERIDSR